MKTCNVASLELDKPKIIISRISQALVTPLYSRIVRAARQDSSFFMLPDSAILFNVGRQLNLNLWYCRVQLRAKSSARVYAITKPDNDGSLLHHHDDIAVKVNDDESTFERESECVTKVGYLSVITGVHKLETAHQIVTAKWWKQVDWTGSNLGGAFSMMVGEWNLKPYAILLGML
jgi:hypothetical protein